MSLEYDYLFKILLIGDSGVGKSALLVQLTSGTFTEQYNTTIGVDFKTTLVSIPVPIQSSTTNGATEDRRTVKLQIWDTAGQERFRTLTNSYYRGVHGIVMVYDVTDRSTFLNIPNWYAEVQQHLRVPIHADTCTVGTAESRVAMLLIGNKTDCTGRQVSFEEGRAMGNELKVPFWETSAKEHSISTIVNRLLVDIYHCSILDNTVRNGQSAQNIVYLNERSGQSSKVPFCCF